MSFALKVTHPAYIFIARKHSFVKYKYTEVGIISLRIYKHLLNV